MVDRLGRSKLGHFGGQPVYGHGSRQPRRDRRHRKNGRYRTREITDQGYDEGQIIAIGFPASGFAAKSLLIEEIDDLKPQLLIDRIALERVGLQERHLDKQDGSRFWSLMVCR